MKPRRSTSLVIFALVLAFALLDGTWSLWSRPPRADAEVDPVLVGTGDIGGCASPGDEATAALLDGIPGTVFTLDDNAYESGRAEDFANCYDRSWDRHKARTRPALGNHDYLTKKASGYFSYFGAAENSPQSGYYSYDLGKWHIVVINSECSRVGGCGPGSSQERWLRADLAAHPTTCTLAYWHHPLFSSGQHGNNVGMKPIWQALYDAGADVVLSGHDHNYERFAPQDAEGKLDPARGLREFVVSTGGKNYYHVNNPIANSELQNDHTFGVIKLTLHPASYTWEFVPKTGKTFTDSGTSSCHAANDTKSTITVTTPTPVADLPFADGFESGDLSQWTNVNSLTIIEQNAYEDVYAVQASSNSTATYMRRKLQHAQNELYVSLRFKVIRHGESSAYLLKFRTNSNDSIMGLLITASGKLAYRNDVGNQTVTSPVVVAEGEWHEAQVKLKVDGPEEEIGVWYDGAPITELSKPEALGKVPAGTIQLGDNATGHNYDIFFDEVAVSTEFVTAQESQP